MERDDVCLGIDGDQEQLFALLRVAQQGPIGETPLRRFFDDIHNAAWRVHPQQANPEAKHNRGS